MIQYINYGFRGIWELLPLCFGRGGVFRKKPRPSDPIGGLPTTFLFTIFGWGLCRYDRVSDKPEWLPPKWTWGRFWLDPAGAGEVFFPWNRSLFCDVGDEHYRGY